ncbi:MAG: oligosaccharide flippase family protein, partial [Nitrososphaera sp.]
INYCIWFCNWGFYLSTTRKVAANRSDPAVLSNVFMATWLAQLTLTAIATAILVFLFSFIPFFSREKVLYIYGIGLLIGNVLTPFWFLNGMERIKDVALIQIITKLLAIPPIFFLIHDSGDAFIFIAINACCSIVMGIATVAWIRKRFLFSYSLPRWEGVFLEVKQGAELFVASAWANLSGVLAPTVLGSIAGPAELGYYNLADRVRGAAITVLHPITAALFPRMCHLFALDSRDTEKLLKQSGGLVIITSAFISLTIYLFPHYIISALGGKDFGAATVALKWLAITPLLITLSSFCTHQVIIPAQKSNAYHAITFSTLCLTGLLVLPMIYWKKSEGAAILVFIAESFFAIATMIYIVKNSFFLKRAIP